MNDSDLVTGNHQGLTFIPLAEIGSETSEFSLFRSHTSIKELLDF